MNGPPRRLGESGYLCCSCGAQEEVGVYVFECDDGQLIDRPLCSACVPPEPMRFGAWAEWAWERRRAAG
jgi:hypothetical protein